jgi:hypothetical protein
MPIVKIRCFYNICKSLFLDGKAMAHETHIHLDDRMKYVIYTRMEKGS